MLRVPSFLFMSVNILAVTLARGGSKGIPKKNLHPIAGKALIQYTFDIIPEIPRITTYIVSTDDPEIQSYTLSKGICSPFLRPPELASDTATSSDALQHSLLFCEKHYSIKYDIVLELMCTNPFKQASHVNAVIDKILSTGADSVIGVSQLHEHHPARIKYLDGDLIRDFYQETSSRRQDLRPHAFIRNGSIYAIQRDLLLHEGYRFGGDNSRAVIMPPPCNINIDEPLDLLLAEAILSGASI